MNETIKPIIGISLILLVIVSVAIPILDGVTYTETEDNTPTGYATRGIRAGVYTPTANGYAIDSANEVQISTPDWVILANNFALVKQQSNYLHVWDFETGTVIQTAQISITSDGAWTATSSGTTYTGTVSGDPIYRTATGTIGTYKNTPFTINKDADMSSVRLSSNNVTINGQTYSSHTLVSGPTKDMQLIGLIVGNNIPIDPAGSTVKMLDNSITDLDIKTYEIAADPQIEITFTYQGESHTMTTSQKLSIAAPLTYTVVTGNPIENLIGIAPIIMIAGIIATAISLLVARRL